GCWTYPKPGARSAGGGTPTGPWPATIIGCRCSTRAAATSSRTWPPSSGISTVPGPYSELHAHSCYSLLDGVSTPEALVERAAEYGLPAFALTDHDAIYGAVP